MFKFIKSLFKKSRGEENQNNIDKYIDACKKIVEYGDCRGHSDIICQNCFSVPVEKRNCPGPDWGNVDWNCNVKSAQIYLDKYGKKDSNE
ncbi:MAG: hypothetical protein PHX80_03850 [Candidatus Nanoarchaeia archaeon]|nr:hypothetical protein [Candidatus Nanoarchaeia archaeon]